MVSSCLLVSGHEVLSREVEGVIVNELMNVRKVSYELGEALNLSQEVLDAMKYYNKKQQLIKVIEEYLGRENPRPTWRTLIEALRSVQCPILARKFEQKYCTTTQGNKDM